jgi:hypothetical protein
MMLRANADIVAQAVGKIVMDPCREHTITTMKTLLLPRHVFDLECWFQSIFVGYALAALGLAVSALRP